MPIKEENIVGYVIFYKKDGADTGAFVRTKRAMYQTIGNMINHKPGMSVAIKPVKTIPEWAKD